MHITFNGYVTVNADTLEVTVHGYVLVNATSLEVCSSQCNARLLE